MGILILAVLVSVVTAAALSFSPVARTEGWRAMVTPLASIIGSGFLICGPLLAKEFGSAAIGAEAVLLLIAYAVGAVIRFNIAHVEPRLESDEVGARTLWMARGNQVLLSLAYAVSVAYYLKLLAEFALQSLGGDRASHALLSNLIVTALIGAMALVVLVSDVKKIEHVAHATVSVKLGVIAGMLVALAAFWVLHGPVEPPPPVKFDWRSVPILLGLVITVQGFETSRYLGHAYEAPIRIRTMRLAQIISSVIYLLFLVLLTPVLAPAARTPGVAGILQVMALTGPFMAVLVLVGGAASQLSAAVADSLGAGGLMNEVSGRKLPIKAAFIAAAALAVGVVWLTNPFQVVALASRAFALFYAMQCVLGIWVSLRTGAGGWPARVAIGGVGLVCLTAAAIGAPAG